MTKDNDKLSKKDSEVILKNLLKQKVYFRKSSLKPGNTILTLYDAKYDAPYDARSLFFVLGLSNCHVLCLNFLWLSVSIRLKFLYLTLKINVPTRDMTSFLKFPY